ncbi:MAG: 5'-nucleotidase C-terminal domain-containing protein [Saccharofermentanales bacterium]|jgi:hypothetical protein
MISTICKHITALLLVVLLACVNVSAQVASELVIQRGPNFSADASEQWWTGSSFGAFTADALRHVTGTDVALVPQSTILGYLGQEDIYEDDIRAVIDNSVVFVRAAVTQEQLSAMLEYSVGGVLFDPNTEQIDPTKPEKSSFVEVSGLSLVFDVSAPSGQRLIALVPDNVSETLIVATTETFLSAAIDISGERLSEQFVDVISEYLRAGIWKTVQSYDGRIRVIGTADKTIVSMFPQWVVIAFPLLTAALFVTAMGRMRRTREDSLGPAFDKQIDINKE